MLEDMVISPASLNDEPLLSSLVSRDISELIASDGIGVEPMNNASIGSLVVSLDCDVSTFNFALVVTELSTGRMDPRVGSGRVGSGRVGSRFRRILTGRVGSGQHFRYFSFLLIISWYLNPYESSNTSL